jgi:flagellar protein FlgJ
MNSVQNELRPTLSPVTDDGAAVIAAAGEPPRDQATRQKIVQAAEGFEAMFIKEMLTQMRKATQTLAGPDSIFSNRINTDMLDMADSAIANQLAKGRSFGISEVLLRQLMPENSSGVLKEEAETVALVPEKQASQGQLAAFAQPLNRPFRQ